jgi:hypothetical protein
MAANTHTNYIGQPIAHIEMFIPRSKHEQQIADDLAAKRLNLTKLRYHRRIVSSLIQDDKRYFVTSHEMETRSLIYRREQILRILDKAIVRREVELKKRRDNTREQRLKKRINFIQSLSQK